jgi:hypothetical protein
MKKIKPREAIPWWLVGYLFTLLVMVTQGNTLYTLDFLLNLFIWPIFTVRYIIAYL